MDRRIFKRGRAWRACLGSCIDWPGDALAKPERAGGGIRGSDHTLVTQETRPRERQPNRRVISWAGGCGGALSCE